MEDEGIKGTEREQAAVGLRCKHTSNHPFASQSARTLIDLILFTLFVHSTSTPLSYFCHQKVAYITINRQLTSKQANSNGVSKEPALKDKRIPDCNLRTRQDRTLPLT